MLVAAQVFIGILMLLTSPKEILDTKLFYTGAQARALLSSFDPMVREQYFRNELLDMLFITSYTGALVLAFYRLFPGKKFVQFLAILPGAFDLIETSAILLALKGGLSWSHFDWLGAVTCMKWVCAGIALAILAAGFIKPQGQKQF